jgi:predicted PurR-regulated permease PerM
MTSLPSSEEEPFVPTEPSANRPVPSLEQRRILWHALTALAVTAIVGMAALIFFGFISFLSWAYPVLLPIGLAVIIALVLEPVVNLIQKRGVHRGTATLGVCVLAVVAFLLFWLFLLPPLVAEGGKFIQSLPRWIDEGVDKLQTLGDDATPATLATPVAAPGIPATTTNQAGVVVTNTAPAPAPAVVPPTRTTRGQRAPPPRRFLPENSEIHDWVASNLPSAELAIQNNIAHVLYTALGPVGQALGFLLGFGFVPIYVYYFLADQERISGHWQEYVPLRASSLRNEVVSVLTEINQGLVKYFRGQIIVAGCNGVLTTIGLTAIGVPYSLILGLMTGVLSIVPFLGIVASILPALLLGFVSSQGWVRPLGVLVVFAVVQMSESMFITPRVQSHSTGLHPLTIIIGILFWSMLLPGLLGPIVAVPLTCAAVVLMRRYVWQRAA